MLIDHPVVLFIFQLTNVTIAVGYLYLALVIVPNLPLQLLQTRIGALGFFALGGLTHLGLVVTALFRPQQSIGGMATSWSTLVLYVAQALSLWMFVTGLYAENGGWGIARRAQGDPPPRN